MDARRQLGLLWGAVAACLIGLAPLAGEVAGRLPGCLFRGLAGLPCPTCGTTRAVLALVRLEPVEAMTLNPLATLAVLGLVGGGLLAGVAAAAGRPLGLPPLRGPLRLLRLSVVGAALANWAYLIRAGI